MATDNKVEDLNLYQRLAKIRKQVEVIQKNKAGFNFKYVSEDEILAKLTVLMDKYHISLVPNIKPNTLQVTPYTTQKTRTQKLKDDVKIYEENDNEVLVTAETTFSWINNDNPEDRLTVDWVIVGQQTDASQAFGSGLTYSTRYFLLKYFNIATPDDDPDSFRSKQKQTEVDEDKQIAAKIIESVDKLIKEELEKDPKSKTEIQAYVKSFVPNGNYLAITESNLAGKLLSGLKEKFNLAEEK